MEYNTYNAHEIHVHTYSDSDLLVESIKEFAGSIKEFCQTLLKKVCTQLKNCPDSIKESWAIGIEAFENLTHQRLTNQTTAVGHRILLAVLLQRTLLALVEQDTDSMRTTHTIFSCC